MVKNLIEESINVKQSMLKNEEIISNAEVLVKTLVNCLRKGNKILIAGNGGSAADAQHFAAELVAKFKTKRKAYAAMALTANSSMLTAWSNDESFDTVFSRQVEAFGKPGDVFIGISTSGNSKNVIEAVAKAKEMGLKTACLLGRNGQLKGMADISINVPSDNTPRIQEAHIMLIHIICEELEKSMSENT